MKRLLIFLAFLVTFSAYAQENYYYLKGNFLVKVNYPITGNTIHEIWDVTLHKYNLSRKPFYSLVITRLELLEPITNRTQIFNISRIEAIGQENSEFRMSENNGLFKYEIGTQDIIKLEILLAKDGSLLNISGYIENGIDHTKGISFGLDKDDAEINVRFINPYNSKDYSYRVDP
jgi:hypothetical protein